MFAASKSSAPFVIQTFTSTATWVAPAGVTGVNISGSGSPAIPDSSQFNTTVYIGVGAAITNSGTNPPYAQWGDLYSEALTALSTIEGNSDTNLLSFSRRNYFVNPNDTWSTQPYTTIDFWIVDSFGYIDEFRGPTPTSGDMTYASAAGNPGWIVTADETRQLGSTGIASTGLSKTFPGGTLTGVVPYRTEVAPTPLAFTGVAVVPGTSYPIVVPPGGVVTISYYR
jgi:hypothetical protein